VVLVLVLVLVLANMTRVVSRTTAALRRRR
jgi:hypothetical protein